VDHLSDDAVVCDMDIAWRVSDAVAGALRHVQLDEARAALTSWRARRLAELRGGDPSQHSLAAYALGEERHPEALSALRVLAESGDEQAKRVLDRISSEDAVERNRVSAVTCRRERSE
jgi:hypothetical protein